MKRTVIQAQPGWSIVQSITDEDGVIRDIYTEPVIAWVVMSPEKNDQWEGQRDGGHYVCGLTVEGVLDDDDPQVFQRPDGKYIVPNDCWFDTAEEVAAFFNEREEQRNEERKKQRAKQKEQEEHGKST